jgi:hypothetical protein
MIFEHFNIEVVIAFMLSSYILISRVYSLILPVKDNPFILIFETEIESKDFI